MRSRPDSLNVGQAAGSTQRTVATSTAAGFLGGRLVAPLGLLVQTALLSRLLEGSRFADFLQLYAAAVIVAGISDLGQRHLLFGALTTRNAGAPSSAYRQANRLKMIGSAVACLLLLLGASFGWLDAAAALGVAALACTLAPGDPACIALRGTGHAIGEALLLTVEQIIVAAVLVVLILVDASLSAVAAMALVSVVGGMRFVIARTIATRRLLGRGPDPENHAWLGWRTVLGVTVSVIVSEGFVRLPLYTVEDALQPQNYAVFAALFLFFNRAGLVSTSLIQVARTAPSRTAWWYSRTTSGPLVIGAVLGVGVLAVAATPVSRDVVIHVLLGADRLSGGDGATVAAVLAATLLAAGAVRIRLQLDGRGFEVTVVTTFASLPHFVILAADVTTTGIAWLVATSAGTYLALTVLVSALRPGVAHLEGSSTAAESGWS